MQENDQSDLRIDRWLWLARFYKTRRLATAAVSAGHVRLNRERAKPASKVRANDRIEVMRDKLRYDLTVLSIPKRRGPAKEAAECFLEDEKSLSKRRELIDGLRQDRRLMPRTDGRPDKRTQRKLRDFHRGKS